jgi:hypothetical protein
MLSRTRYSLSGKVIEARGWRPCFALFLPFRFPVILCLLMYAPRYTVAVHKAILRIRLSFQAAFLRELLTQINYRQHRQKFLGPGPVPADCQVSQRHQKYEPERSSLRSSSVFSAIQTLWITFAAPGNPERAPYVIACSRRTGGRRWMCRKRA